MIEDRDSQSSIFYPRFVLLLAADHLGLSFGRDHNRLGVGVMLDRLFAVFFAETALFHAAKRQLVIDDLCRVDPGVPNFDSLRASHGPVDVACPDRRTQTEDGIIRLLDGLLEILDSNDRQSRAED